jgi:ubiquinone/menaquinone biosynthesis C-methylase UbiE
MRDASGMRTFEEEWRERFERFARCHDVDHLVSGWSDIGLRRRLALFDECLGAYQLPTPARVLDLGCGAGTYVRFLASHGHWVVGLDYSLPSLTRALTTDPQRAGCYIEGEAYHLPFRDECLDLVVSIGVLQALGDPERALDEMIRVLCPKGLLVVEFLNAFELIALVRSVGERLKGQCPRVRTYSPFQVHRWFTQRGLKLIRRASVYLPPRGLPELGRIFERKGVVRLLENVPGLSLAGAHAFLFVGEKEVRDS